METLSYIIPVKLCKMHLHSRAVLVVGQTKLHSYPKLSSVRTDQRIWKRRLWLVQKFDYYLIPKVELQRRRN